MEEIVSQAVSQTISPQSQKSWWSYLFCCCRKTKPINADLLKAEIMKRINVYDICLQTFPALFDNSSVATCIMNKSGKTVYTNKANRNWIAHALSNDGSLDFSKFIHRDDLEKVSSLFAKSITSKKSIKYECRGFQSDGTDYWVSVSITPIRWEEKPLFFIARMQDITQRVLLQMNLELRVTTLTEQLRKERDKEIKANKNKSRYLANTSHEIRTPLNTILSSLEEYQEQSPSLKDREQCLESAISAANHLKTLVDTVLDLEKIEAGEFLLDNSPFLMQKLVMDIVKKLNAHKRLKIRLPTESIFVKGDPKRLTQVLINLVGNALKFSNPEIVILTVEKEISTDECKTSKQTKKDTSSSIRLRFTITDTGPGIAPEKIATIFQPFKQESTAFGGTGLGLSISKEFVKAMGGSLKARSPIRGALGSEFYFSIDFQQSVSVPTLKSSAGNLDSIKMHLKGKRILLAEDNSINARLLSKKLKRYGMLCSIANNGLEVIKLMDQQDVEKFDLILMDCQMPQMNGLEASQIVRKKHPEIPIIALTADATVSNRESCYKAGMNSYLTKPAETLSLLMKIHNFIPTCRNNLEGAEKLI